MPTLKRRKGYRETPPLSYICLTWTGEDWDIWDPCAHTYLIGLGDNRHPVQQYSEAIEFLLDSDWETYLFGELMQPITDANRDIFMTDAIVPGTKIHLLFYWTSSYSSGPDGDDYETEIMDIVWRIERPKDWLHLGIEMAERVLTLPYLIEEKIMVNRILYYFSIDFEKNIEDIFNHQMMQIEQDRFE